MKINKREVFMTNKTARLGALAVALAVVTALGLSPGAAHAQSTQLMAHIPFDFFVGSQLLPAGRYTVKPMADHSVLRISDGDGHSSLTLTTGVYNPSGVRNPQMLFNRYEGQYFLSEVRWPGYTTARQLVKSPLEIRLAKNIAPERIIAASNNR
jgi:hypothetical protein